VWSDITSTAEILPITNRKRISGTRPRIGLSHDPCL